MLPLNHKALHAEDFTGTVLLQVYCKELTAETPVKNVKWMSPRRNIHFISNYTLINTSVYIKHPPYHYKSLKL